MLVQDEPAEGKESRFERLNEDAVMITFGQDCVSVGGISVLSFPVQSLLGVGMSTI